MNTATPLRQNRPRQASLLGWLGSKQVAPWILLAPMLAFAVVFFILPLFYAFFISFTKWDSLTPPKWVGFDNYKYILTVDPVYWKTFWNTL